MSMVYREVVNDRKFQGATNDLVRMLLSVNRCEITDEERKEISKNMIIKLEELKVNVEKQSSGYFITKTKSAEFDMARFANTMCYDMIYVVKQFLGKRFLKFPTLLSGDFQDAINKFNQWSRGAKRLFIKHNVIKLFECSAWTETDDLSYHLIKKNGNDLDKIIWCFRWGRCYEFKVRHKKKVCVKQEYKNDNAIRNLILRILWVDKRVKDNTPNMRKEIGDDKDRLVAYYKDNYGAV